MLVGFRLVQRTPGVSGGALQSFQLKATRAKAWCLLMHAEPSLSLYPALRGTGAKAWCILMHAEPSLSSLSQID
jgi:hypothetical protein